MRVYVAIYICFKVTMCVLIVSVCASVYEREYVCVFLRMCVSVSLLICVSFVFLCVGRLADFVSPQRNYRLCNASFLSSS